jgi:NitT/TauT family transport system substrate-binding protein
VVSGAASGGAFLVVKPSINSAADLKGKKLADPQLNGTQDIALRWYLKQHGYTTDASGGGDVHVVPQENAQTLTAFKNGDIDGAWVPEPWATRLVTEGGGKILVDERDEWPNKQFVTTVLLVSKSYLAAHPDTVRALVAANAKSIDTINADPAKATPIVAAGITKAAGKAIKDSLVAASFKSITFRVDPIASSLYGVADHAAALGGKKAALDGIFDLSMLNAMLSQQGKPAVASK